MPHNSFQCDPLNDGLYEGNAGIGLFLAALYRSTGNDEYRRGALRAFAPLRAFIAREGLGPSLINGFGLGLGGGVGGIAAGLGPRRPVLDDTSLSKPPPLF